MPREGLERSGKERCVRQKDAVRASYNSIPGITTRLTNHIGLADSGWAARRKPHKLSQKSDDLWREGATPWHSSPGFALGRQGEYGGAESRRLSSAKDWNADGSAAPGHLFWGLPFFVSEPPLMVQQRSAQRGSLDGSRFLPWTYLVLADVHEAGGEYARQLQDLEAYSN